VERKQTKTYRLIDLRDGRVWDSNNPSAIVDLMFIFTMWPPHAAVYAHGERYRGRLSGETGKLERKLIVFAHEAERKFLNGAYFEEHGEYPF
jgi:hypothetical protein